MFIFFPLQNGQLCDAVILVNNDTFHAHKIMLCAGSRYFAKYIIESKFPPGRENSPMFFICTDKVTPAQMLKLLDYIYEGEIQVQESVSSNPYDSSL